MDDTTEDVLRVTNISMPQSVAAAATTILRRGGHPKLRAIGAGAVNQALKAAIISRSQMALRGVDVVIRAGFVDLEGRQGMVTGISLELLPTDALG